MKVKKLLFTFDYELFLGKKSGTLENCLFKPTNYLLNIFDQFEIRKAIFFVDTTYLCCLKQNRYRYPELEADYRAIKKHLRLILKKGHYVFPHLHPHWLDAKYVKEHRGWELIDLSRYRLHDISYKRREELFSKSIHILDEIISPVCQNYRIDAYRAGGWSLQPFSVFKPYFDRYGIKFDFSVLPGFAQFTNAQYYDFRNVPEKPVYRFNHNVIQEEETGDYVQFTISTLKVPYPVQFADKVLNKVLSKMNDRSMGEGVGVQPEPLRGKMKDNKEGKQNREMVSIELLNHVKLPLYKQFIKKNSYMHFISHPKMLTNHNLKSFENFLNYLLTKFKIETDFRKMNLPLLLFINEMCPLITV